MPLLNFMSVKDYDTSVKQRILALVSTEKSRHFGERPALIRKVENPVTCSKTAQLGPCLVTAEMLKLLEEMQIVFATVMSISVRPKLHKNIFAKLWANTIRKH
jgi:hypothetical protein